MSLQAFTDVRSSGESGEPCPRCDSVPRVGKGLCLACLLQSAIEDAHLLEADEFEAALDSISVGDTHWRLGNYEILEEIGRGGMGIIYRARQRHSRRIVALKRIQSYHADSRDTLVRFRREAEAAASLDHPNILPIYEVGEVDGVPFFSMKFAAGGSLQDLAPVLRADKREVVRLMAKVARAVQYAHRQGILHRDLKPGNVLLDAKGEPLVSDFGLAKWLDASNDLTRTLTIFGTPGYIAPEQATGATDLTPAADVYSLGAILFSLLAGRPPFLGEHALAVIKQAAEQSAPKLRSLVHSADKDLETICARCLERLPETRYRSAGDLAEDLERWLEGRPIIARPIAFPTRVWRWARRNPVLASAALLAGVLAATLVLVQLGSNRLERTVEQAAVYKHSVAVMPFLDLDSATVRPDFAKKFAESLRVKMAGWGPARVLSAEGMDSSNSIATPDAIRVISSKLATRTVVCGTTRQLQNQLNVSIRLLDSRSGRLFVQRSFKLESASSSESQIAATSAVELITALTQDEPPEEAQRDPALRNKLAAEYLRAGHEFETRRDKVNLDRALDCFAKAASAEPSSALARAYFAMAAVTRFYYAQASPDLLSKAEQLGREAAQLNPALPDAHRALGGLFYAQGDLSASREQALEAIELGGPNEGPVVSVGMIAKVLGRPDLSIRWHKLAKVIQEHPSDYEFGMADCWADLCDDGKAEEIYQRVSALHPDLPEGWVGICRLRVLQGQFEAAREIYRKALSDFPNFPFATQMAAQVEFFSRNWLEAERLYRQLAEADHDGGAEFYGAITFQSALGRLCQIRSANEHAKEILNECLATRTEAANRAPNNPDILYRLAAVEASLGHTDDSLQHLRSAFENGRLDYRSLKLDPRFDVVRDDPRFMEICDAMATQVAALRARATKNNAQVGQN